MLNVLNRKPQVVAAPSLPVPVAVSWAVDDQPEVLAAFKKKQVFEDEMQSRRATQSAVLNERNALVTEIQGLVDENDASHLAAHRDGQKVLSDVAQTARYDRLQTLERDVRILDDRLAALQKEWNASGLDEKLNLATARWSVDRDRAQTQRRRAIEAAAIRAVASSMFDAINTLRMESLAVNGDSAAVLFMDIRDNRVTEYIRRMEEAAYVSAQTIAVNTAA